MKDLTEKKLTVKDYLLVASMLFALFFGAGNLIFPLHLGQLSGQHWLPAALGFLVTGVLLPLMSVLAIALTKSRGVYDIGLPLGPSFALVFMVLIHATIGPLFGTPRTATVSFAVGFAPLIPAKFQTPALLIFSAIFFTIAFLISYTESKIVSNLGKLLNPIFLALLFLFFTVAFLHPLGNPMKVAATSAYNNGAFINGFLEGYNTLDALAGLAFGVTVVTAVKSMGYKKPASVAKVTAKAGLVGMSAVAVIYLLLIVTGAMSLGEFKVSADGGVAFSQLVNAYAGVIGQAFLAVLITLTCLTTAVGLVAAFAQDFHKHFPKVSYHQWLFLSSFASFLTANVGLAQIISWSTPILMFLYPLAMVLIFLSVFSSFFKKNSFVYLTTIVMTFIPAFLDMVAAAPSLVTQSAMGKSLLTLRSYLPLADLGLSWLIPAILGFSFGLLVYRYHLAGKQKVIVEAED
ncbi:branched-chain amino acid:cation transporter, LIVCS family [Ligilactobacillus sp. WC1T17]|uniref:Branched-chain amino acid transport system carrier protein n=1 Tax=Ligilactobacillus ruminis TaxID=1623 RepID=A0ABY1A9Z9_9LACO|nr:branched-chain amino acid:cation transporter, LIVCS family [Ligilactobacillus ruminis]